MGGVYISSDGDRFRFNILWSIATLIKIKVAAEIVQRECQQGKEGLALQHSGRYVCSRNSRGRAGKCEEYQECVGLEAKGREHF